MELFNLAGAVDEAISIIPCIIQVMSLPLSLVLKDLVSDSASEDLGDVVFWFTIDDSRGRWRFHLAWERIHGCLMKPVSTEDVVHLYMLGEVKDI